MHKRKINIIINRPRTGSQNLFLMTTINEISNHIMGYFNGTLDAFGYTAQSVNEISNPDESYMGTLNLQFRDYPIDEEQDDDMIYQYTSIYNAIENGNQTTGKQKSSNNLQYQNYLTNLINNHYGKLI